MEVKTQQKISKTEYMYNIFRLENIKVKRDSVPTLLNRITTDDINIDGILKTENIFRAWEFVVRSHSDKPSLDYIKQINRLIDFGMHGEYECEGSLRTKSVKIVGSVWKPPIPIGKSVARTINQIVELPDDVEKSIELLMYLMKYQLFADGNKRTSLLTACSILYNKGYVISVPFIKQRVFFEKLIDYYENENKKEILKRFLINETLFERKDF